MKTEEIKEHVNSLNLNCDIEEAANISIKVEELFRTINKDVVRVLTSLIVDSRINVIKRARISISLGFLDMTECGLREYVKFLGLCTERNIASPVAYGLLESIDTRLSSFVTNPSYKKNFLLFCQKFSLTNNESLRVTSREIIEEFNLRSYLVKKCQICSNNF